MRKIAVFTGTRADYGLLRPVLAHLQAVNCSVQLIVSGTHLSPAYGSTLQEIEEDGYEPACCIPFDVQTDSRTALCASLGDLVGQLGAALAQLRPAMLLLLGDRYECLGAATAAAMLGIPVAHIHGGEITQGAVDECFRHAITKLSHVHFTSCEAYRHRVIQLGEQPARVWNVGALGVENALHLPLLSAGEVRHVLGLVQGQPYFLCTFHPVTLEAGSEEEQLQALLNALDAYPKYGVIFTGANADFGGAKVNRLLHAYAAQQPKRVRRFQSLGALRYLSAARYAACVVGNSSSGILEVPSLGTPVVDIGNRQKGRLRSDAVLHCEPECAAIHATIAMAMGPEHRQRAAHAVNPYAGKDTAARIAHVLATTGLEDIQKKIFYDLP